MIIEHPSLVPFPRRLGWACVTVVFWAAWFYLWLPFVTLAAWSFGFYQAYANFHWEQELMELRQLLILYARIVALLGSGLLMWAFSEYLRFRNVRRRFAAIPASPAELAAFAGLDSAELVAWQGARRLIAQHDVSGMLTGAAGSEGFSQIERAACTPLLAADSIVAG